MEMKLSSSSSGEVLGGSGCKKRPPSRLQKKAPASLNLEQPAGPAGAPAASPAAAWSGDGRTPIPLLSPLVMSPAPAWEADQGGSSSRREGQAEGTSATRHGAGSNGERRGQSDEKPKTPAPAPSGGWRHPAMPTPTPASSPAPAPSAAGGWRHPALPTPVAEPASLTPLFKSQCAVEVRNAQQ